DVGACRTEAEAPGRVIAASPDVARLRLLQLGMLGGASEGRLAEDVRVRLVERRLERGGRDVAVQHARVLVVEERGFHAPAQERLRLAHEVLVERVLAGDEDREPVLAPAGPSPLLAEARDRSREPDR